MPIRLIATDLDRTLLDSSGRLPPVNRGAIEKAANAGIPVVLASGRPFAALPRELIELPGVSMAITGNGCAVCACPFGERLWSAVLPAAAVDAILSLPEAAGYPMECFVNGEAFASACFVADPLRYSCGVCHADYIQTTRKPVEDIRSFIAAHREELDSVDVIVPSLEERELVRSAAARLPGVYVTVSCDYLVEIASEEAGKDKALKLLLNLMDISPSDAAAFGDGENDADMLRSVGWGFAVRNAVPVCKEVARFITDTNDRGGFALAVKELLRGLG